MPVLQFKGKTFVQNHHLMLEHHQLVPDAERSLTDAPSLTDNLVIQGDNLLTLKALLPSFAGRVKCIYIDPPYNTGNENWVYNDNVNSPEHKEWFRKVVSRDDLTRHDRWLCMMLPRLKLLRELLRDDGAIFISIDDNEVHHLRALLDELFGEENFVATIVSQKKYSSANDNEGIAAMHDYIVVYQKSSEWNRQLLPRTEKNNSQYRYEDKKGIFRVNEQFVGKVYLPCFVVPDTQGRYREFNYQADLLSRIDWDSFDLTPVHRWELNPTTEGDASIRVNLTSAINAISVTTATETDLDPVFLSRQVADIVPNPWVAYDYANQTIDLLKQRFPPAIIRRNRSFIIDELRKLLIAERNMFAEAAFRHMIASKELRFYLIKGVAGTAIPERVTVTKGTPRLVHNDNSPAQRSLFEYEPENQFNSYERAVALYLDKQDRVLWWYRNIANVDYSVQGWQPRRVYPDQVALSENLAPTSREKSETVYVIETKGLHLKNEDTDYKRILFDLCNEQATPQPWDAIKDELADHQVKFQLLFSDEWEKVLNAVFAA